MIANLFDIFTFSIAPEICQVTNFWLWTFFGRLHPLIVHFPIALLIIAFILELFSLNKKILEMRMAIDVLLIVGALTAIVAVIFGLLLKTQDDYGGTTLTIHQWSGIATAILALATVLMHRLVIREYKAYVVKVYRALLVFTVFSVTVAGHYGASLTHGADFLTSTLPWNDEFKNSNFDIKNFSSAETPVLSVKQIADLNLEVRSIFAHNCYKCHSSEKIKGELRLDRKVFVMRGGESGDVISAGHPEKSEMIRRLELPRDDEESMPPKGKTLTSKEIATLKFWIKIGAPWPENADEKSVYRVAALEPRRPSLPPNEDKFENPIDRFVDAYFTEKKISWPESVSDRTYIRRVYLDIIGLLPPPEKVDAFVDNRDPDKRVALVTELLERNDDYAQHWLTFWNDALRNDYSGTGYITEGRFAITDWLYESLRQNKPYDIFVSELISPNERSEGFIRGIQWRGTVNASQRVEMQAAQNVSQVFLGLNLKCASCHDSFISDWKLTDAYAFANIFSDSALEINRCDVPTGTMASTKIIFTELGTIDSTVSVERKLKQLAEYLTAPKNGRLYRTIVNRIWSQLTGRGIVAPVDLMDNVPWSQDLLDWLASDFVANGNDLKRLIYLITTSKTYQTQSVELKSEGDLLTEEYAFRGMHRRRLSAEQFSDAVSAIVYPVYHDTLKAFKPSAKSQVVASTPFVRASLVKNDRFLTSLGRPNRENVSTDRASQANLLQALELTNGSVFYKALREGAKRWRSEYQTSEEIVNAVYKKALGRKPELAELKAAVNILGRQPDDGAIEDLLWAVMLLPEFQLIY
jgi:uncharacterized membrane protein